MIRPGWLRSCFGWPPAIACPHIFCWAVTPFSTPAKPRQRSEAATLWTSYLTTWTAWNHVRMAAALAAAALFTIALRVRA